MFDILITTTVELKHSMLATGKVFLVQVLKAQIIQLYFVLLTIRVFFKTPLV